MADSMSQPLDLSRNMPENSDQSLNLSRNIPDQPLDLSRTRDSNTINGI